MIQIRGFFSKLFWLLMALHLLLLSSEFPEVLEEKPLAGYILSEKKLPASSFLKRIKSLPGIPEKMMQEETLEYPDYVPLGLKNRTELAWSADILSGKGIPFKEINLPEVHPDGHYPPPEVSFS